jgi:hypothetical protein
MSILPLNTNENDTTEQKLYETTQRLSISSYEIATYNQKIATYTNRENWDLDTRQIIENYSHIVIVTEHGSNKEYNVYQMTDEFKNAFKNLNPNYNLFYTIIRCFKHAHNIYYIAEFILINKLSSGGKKAVVKHTVKQLQAIASKNNIKITKKVDGKTVRLNKQGLIAKLKRYKLI